MSKQPKTYHKTTFKLPKNYKKKVQTPLPFLRNVQKKAQKNQPQNFWIRAEPTPPLPFGQCPKVSSFFGGNTSLTHSM